MANDDNIFSAKNIAQMKRGQTEYEKAIKGMRSGASDLQDALSKSPDEIYKIGKALGMSKDAIEDMVFDIERSSKGFKLSTDRVQQLQTRLKDINKINSEYTKVQEAHDA